MNQARAEPRETRVVSDACQQRGFSQQWHNGGAEVAVVPEHLWLPSERLGLRAAPLAALCAEYIKRDECADAKNGHHTLAATSCETEKGSRINAI